MPEQRLQKAREGYDSFVYEPPRQRPAYLPYDAHCPYNVNGHQLDRRPGVTLACHFCGVLVP